MILENICWCYLEMLTAVHFWTHSVYSTYLYIKRHLNHNNPEAKLI